MNQSGSVIMQADVAAAPAGGMGGMNEVESMMPGKGGAPAFGMEGEGSAGMGMGMGMGMELDPADNRYVDTQFKPIAAADLRTKMASSDPADAPYVVAKRIPVRLRFSKMDQRKLNKLIAECGNTGTPENPRLVLEVRQVRVNGAAVSTSGMGMGGMGAWEWAAWEWKQAPAWVAAERNGSAWRNGRVLFGWLRHGDG